MNYPAITIPIISIKTERSFDKLPIVPIIAGQTHNLSFLSVKQIDTDNKENIMLKSGLYTYAAVRNFINAAQNGNTPEAVAYWTAKSVEAFALRTNVDRVTVKVS